jgi:hypothetical protein
VSYRVGQNVKTHDAYGVGAYSMNMVENFFWKSGFSAPATPDVKFHGAYGWAICNGGELNLINDVGGQIGSEKETSNIPNLTEKVLFEGEKNLSLP